MSAFFKSSQIPTYLNPDIPSYALITGASDGIGYGFAEELLSRGFNVVLHGRNPTKLEQVKSKLQSTYPARQVHKVIADAASFTQHDIDRIVSEVSQIDNMNLTILVNNVGGTGVLPCNFQTFTAHTATEISGLVNLNILFTVQLTHALIPVLKQHGKKSLIINTSSQAYLGLAFLPVYSGTKAFIHAWSHALAVEFASYAENQPIEVLEILVGSVQTQQNQIEKPTFFVPSSREMARSALERVGCGTASGIAAYWPHALQQWMYNMIPGFLFDRLTVSMLKGVVGKKEKIW